MQKILFLNPIKLYKRWPFPSDFVRFFLDFPSLAFIQLASFLPNHECEILDGTVERINIRKFSNIIKSKDIVAISVHSSIISLNAELNLSLIKKIKPEIKVIMGGHHPTIFHKEWLKKGADFIVRNEGEITLQELVEAIDLNKRLEDIRGISYKVEDEIKINPDREFLENIDSLPMPRWELLNYKKYNSSLLNSGFSGAIETSRGCGHKCHFCLVPSFWGEKQRFKSVDTIINELIYLKRLGVNKFYFVDDNFGSNYNRDLDLCKDIIKHKLKIEWMCFSRADYIKNKPELYEVAAKAGMKMVLTGFETMKCSNLQLMNKGYEADMSLNDYIRIFKFLKRNEIFVIGLFVIGYPLESYEDIKFTLAHYHLVCDFPLMTPFRPAKTTEAYKLVENNILGDMFYFDSQVKVVKTIDFISLHRNFVLKLILNPYNFFKVFSKNKVKGSFFKAYFIHLLRNLCDMNFDSLQDLYYILFFSKKSKKLFIDKIVKRYLKKVQYYYRKYCS